MSNKNWTDPSMIIVASKWAGVDSFSLIPVKEDCPYVEAMYDPRAKTLAVIGKTKKESFHMVPRLDDNGNPIKVKGAPEGTFKRQRVNQESYAEYYITERSDIEKFIQNFTCNHIYFDYKKILDFEPMSDPEAIAKGPQLITS